MRTPIIGALVLLCMGGCAKSASETALTVKAGLQVAQVASPKVEKTIAVLDRKTATASAQLAQKCGIAQLALAGGSLLQKSSAGAIGATRTMVSDFCANPPQDVASAVILLGAAIDDLKAQGVTWKSLTTLRLKLRAAQGWHTLRHRPAA